MISTKVIVFQIFFIIATAAHKYDILFRDENMFSPCDIPNVKEIREYFDYSNTTFEFLNNGSLYIHGSYELIKDIGLEDNPMSVQVFKKIRSSWVNTVYTIRRGDFCKAVFDSHDIWYKYTKGISPEEQNCPFYKGKIFTIDEATDLTIDLADPRFSGEFKFETMITFKGINETICANIFAEIYFSNN